MSDLRTNAISLNEQRFLQIKKENEKLTVVFMNREYDLYLPETKEIFRFFTFHEE